MSDPKLHILVCDDEHDLRDMVGEYLEKRGHQVTLAANGAVLEDILNAGTEVDVVLLDINMPGDDGLTVLRRLGSDRDFAVIMLTAAGEVVDRIVGLEMGADDYLAKPVHLRELDARIKAVLRRPGRRDAAAASEPGAEGEARTGTVRFAGFSLDLSGARLFREDGGEVPLTSMEFRLLKVFVEHPGRVLNRDQLLELAHDRGWDPYDRSIDIRISRLRRKIETNAAKPELIRTVRGLGYIFSPDGT